MLKQAGGQGRVDRSHRHKESGPHPEVGCPRDPSEEDSVEGGPEQLLRHREWGVHLVS